MAMSKRGNIIYLAGPMANVAEFNRPAFHAAEAALAAKRKYVVINPAKLPIGLHADDYMHYAEHRGLPVYRLVDGEMIDTLE